MLVVSHFSKFQLFHILIIVCFIYTELFLNENIKYLKFKKLLESHFQFF